MEIFFSVLSAIIAARFLEWVFIAAIQTYVPKVVEFISIWRLWVKERGK